MMLRTTGTVALAFLALLPQGQNLGSVDLTQPDPTIPSDHETAEWPLSAGCTEFKAGSIADGYVRPEGGQPREISTSVSKIGAQVAVEGNELGIEVQLKTSGYQSIEIPSNRDLVAVIENQGPIITVGRSVNSKYC